MDGRVIALGAGAAVAVLVLGSSALTHARWTDAAGLDGGAVAAGELAVLSGDGTTQVGDYVFDALTGEGLGPDDHAQAPLVISNGGTVDLRYRLAAVTAAPDELAGWVLTAMLVEAVGDCPAGVNAADPSDPVVLFDGPVSAAISDWQVVPTAGAATWCLRVGPGDAADPADPAESRLVFTFRAEST